MGLEKKVSEGEEGGKKVYFAPISHFLHSLHVLHNWNTSPLMEGLLRLQVQKFYFQARNNDFVHGGHQFWYFVFDCWLSLSRVNRHENLFFLSWTSSNGQW